MTDRLKGTVSISYKVNLGNYQMMQIEAHREHWMDDELKTADQLAILDGQVMTWMKGRGVAPTIVRAVPKDEQKK